MIAVLVPVEPVLTLESGRAAVIVKLRATERQGSALGFRVGKCHRIGATVVCSFSMRMRRGAKCTGRVQVRMNAGDVEGRYLGPRSHPAEVVCK